MDHEIFTPPAHASLVNGSSARVCTVPDSLIARLNVTTGRPSKGLLSDDELASLSDADIFSALAEISSRFRAATERARNAPDDEALRRTLAQLAMNKRSLEDERESRSDLRAAS